MIITDTLQAGQVARFHAAPYVQPQTVGLHSWGVAALVLYIRPAASREVLIEALLHDTMELYTGDIPVTAKRDYWELQFTNALENRLRSTCGLLPVQGLSESEKVLLKVCDILEGVLWCRTNECGMKALTRGINAFGKYRDLHREFLTVEEWNLCTPLL